MRRSIAAGMLFLPSLLLFGLACSPSHTSLCEQAARCGGGRELEIESCVVSMDAREDQAEIFSSFEQWEAYLECLDENGTCVDNALGGCEGREEALNDCINDRRVGQARVDLVAAD